MTRTRNISDLLDSNGDVKVTSLDNAPAVDLTNLSATNLTSGTIPAARFPSTIDGRDLSTDGTKLDGIEASATADQTASEILTAVKTVDGASSGLDADLLDGQHGSHYLDANNFTNMPSSELSGDSTPQLAGNLDTNGNDINFGDNDKAQFGAGSDLEIYHDGSHSYIRDEGTGNLQVTTNNRIFFQKNPYEPIAIFDADGAVTLYHDNAAKIATSASGATVTGTLGATTVDLGNWTITESGGVLFFATSGTNKMKLDASGNLTVVGDVTAFGSM